MSFRGEDFVAIDETAIGDGDTTTLPLDTFVQNRLQSNLMFLAQEPRTVAWTPIIKHADDDATLTGIRTVGVITSWVTLTEGVLFAPSKTNQYEVSFLANIQAQGADSDVGDLKLRAIVNGRRCTVSVNGGTASAIATLDNTDGDWIPVTLVLTSPESIPTNTQVEFAIFVRSEHSSDRAGTAAVFTNDQIIGASSALFDNTLSATPNTADLSVQYLTLIDGSGDPGDEDVDQFDMLGYGRSSGGAVGQEVTPSAASFDDVDAQRHYMSYIQVRGMAYRPMPPAESVTYQPKSALEALKVPASVTALRHLEAIRELHDRPRLLAQGPNGTLSDSIEDWSTLDIPYIWPFVKGNLSVIPGDELINCAIKPMTDEGSIKVWMRVLCVQEFMGTTDVDERGSAEWSLSFDLEQPVDTSGDFDWSTDALSLGSISITPRIQISRSGLTTSKLLRTVAIMERTSRSTFHNFAHFEGSIFEGEDMRRHTQEIQVSIPVSGYGALQNPWPVRLRAYVDTALTLNDVEFVPGVGASLLTSSVRLYCLGYRVTETGVTSG